MGRPRALGPGGRPGDLWGCHPLPKPLHGSLLPTGPGSSPLWPHLPPLLWPLRSSHPTLAPPPHFPEATSLPFHREAPSACWDGPPLPLSLICWMLPLGTQRLSPESPETPGWRELPELQQ